MGDKDDPHINLFFIRAANTSSIGAPPGVCELRDELSHTGTSLNPQRSAAGH